MTATGRTEHYESSRHTEDDHPAYTGDCNGDMRKIDAAIHAASQSGMTAVTHTNDLTGNGTPDGPLGVAEAMARTESVAQAIAEAMADRPTAGDIKPGNGIRTGTSGNQAAISYAGGGLGTVAHDTTSTGDGTQNKPPGIGPGTATNPVDDKRNSMDFNDCHTNGIHTFNGRPTNGPRPEWTGGALMASKGHQVVIRLFFTKTFGAASPMAVRTAGIANEGGPRCRKPAGVAVCQFHGQCRRRFRANIRNHRTGNPSSCANRRLNPERHRSGNHPTGHAIFR